MVDARELRIGNYVNTPHIMQSFFRIDGFEYLYDEDYKVAMNTGTIKVDNVIGEIRTHPLTWYKKHLSPIPLSSDILEKCGFKYGKVNGISSFEEHGNDPEGITHYWDIRIKGTDLVESHSISLVKWGEQEYFTF